MILGLVVGVIIVFGLVTRVYFMRVREDVFRGPHLHARIDALFESYAGQHPTPDLVTALQAQGDALFQDILTGVGLEPNDWSLVVLVDDLLGPVPRLRGPDGQLLHLADFEQRLRDGRIDLGSG